MTGDLLRVQGLRLGYARSDVVHGISFHVPRGSIVSLIGANGAGKSTTLRGLSGLLKPRAGSIVFSGQEIAGEAPHKIARRRLVQVPEGRIAEAKQAAEILGDAVYSKLPFSGSTKPMSDDLAQLVLNRTWRPALAVTGMDGYPMPENAGNVLLPYTSTKLSFRLPPTCDAEKATKTIKQTLEADAPYGAHVEFDAEEGQGGWNAPALAPWLAESLKRASTKHFGASVAFMGEGGSIPFMAMLGKRYPKTQFVVTGVLGPHSNAHGPNEFLHIPTGKKVSACIADILADHAAQ